MKESINSLEMNFSNQAGGHTATVGTILNAKNIDGTEGLGTVIGGLDDEFSEFSNSKIAEKMKNFVCVAQTTTTGPTQDTRSRSYVDRTSLVLSSYIVLVRGLNAPPEKGTEFDGPLPYFTEVAGSPLESLSSSGPKVIDHVIYAGKIYNSESAQRFDGVKLRLVYQNKELKENLCINSDFASPQYKGSPDLSQYNLTFGYTLSEFNTMMKMVGLQVNGLPSDDDLLFETSGSLASVATSIASSLGYFYYIHPEDGSVNFINSSAANQIRLTDYKNTRDENILSTQFTESLRKQKVVNTYVGSAEKEDPNKQDKSFTTEDRPRPVYFKRVYLDENFLFKRIITSTEIGCFFDLYAQREENEIKDRFIWFVLWLNRNEILKDVANLKRNINITNLYPYKFTSIDEYAYNKKDVKLKKLKEKCYIYHDEVAKEEDKRKTDLIDTRFKRNIELDRYDDKFSYIRLNSAKLKVDLFKNDPDEEDIKEIEGGALGIKPERPSSSRLNEFLKAYFAIAGGIYITNAYSKYKVEHMDFQNTADLSITGPFHKDETLKDIDDLSDIADVFEAMRIRARDITIETLAKMTKGESKGQTDYYFVAIRPLKNLEKIAEAKPLDFSDFSQVVEMVDNFPDINKTVWLGGPHSFMRKQAAIVGRLVSKSVAHFKNALDHKKTIKCTFIRSKTRVNPIGEEDEEDEDNEISESSDSDQQLSDLFDRYDLKYYSVESPKYNLLNEVSHSASSGTTVDMRLLKRLRGNMTKDLGSPQTSSRTLYGLHLPDFKPTMNSISVSVGADGIKTSIKESTIKLIPVSQTTLLDRANNSFVPNRPISAQLGANQRNFLGL